MTETPTGDRIRRARTEARLTQEQLAEQAGVTANTIRRMERGEPVRQNTLDAVSSVLGIPMARGYSPDVETIRDVIGEWLEAMPRDKRAEARKHVMRLVFNDPQD